MSDAHRKHRQAKGGKTSYMRMKIKLKNSSACSAHAMPWHARHERHGQRLEALEAGGHALAAVVEDEAEIDGQVEVDAEDVALDGGAEAQGGLKVDEPFKQRAAGLRGRHADLGLDEAQHVGAHAQLQRVAGALAFRGRRRGRRRRRRRRAVAAAGAV